MKVKVILIFIISLNLSKTQFVFPTNRRCQLQTAFGSRRLPAGVREAIFAVNAYCGNKL